MSAGSPGVSSAAIRLIERVAGPEAAPMLASYVTDVERLVLSGSLVEGIGNHRSDLDLYLLSDARSLSCPVRMAFSRGTYLDLEVVRPASLVALADDVERAATAPAAVTHLRIGDIGRYYRLSIGLCVSGPRSHQTLIDRFDRAVSCAVLASWSAWQGEAFVARARLARRSGAVRAAASYANQAAHLAVSAELAWLGEGYPGLKWTVEKAARNYGRDDPAFRQVEAVTRFGEDAGVYVDDVLGWFERSAPRSAPGLSATDPGVVRPGTAVVEGPTGSGVAAGRRVAAVTPEDLVALEPLVACGWDVAVDRLLELPGMAASEAKALLHAVAADLRRIGALDDGTTS